MSQNTHYKISFISYDLNHGTCTAVVGHMQSEKAQISPHQGGESRLILVILYLYSDRMHEKIVHYFPNTQQIFMW